MTPEELQVRQFEIEAETRRREIRAGVWKVAVGTGVVGIAAAFFPFAQQYATVKFATQVELAKAEADDRKAQLGLKLEVSRAKAAQEIQQIEAQHRATLNNRAFLASLATEGRSKNLDDRIILAEYYYYLAEDVTERGRWAKFLAHLNGLQTAQREAALKAAEIRANPDSKAVEIAVASTKARLLDESSAAGGAAQGPPAQARGRDLPQLLDDLSSETAHIRRSARGKLGELGLELVRPAMIELGEANLTYRVRLGLVVALTQMLREHKAQRRQVSELLNPNDLETLFQAAIDDDRTLRVHASEFLYDLADPRSLDTVVSLWDSDISANGRYNLAFIINSVAGELRGEDIERAREALTRFLESVGPNPKTRRLIEDALEKLR